MKSIGLFCSSGELIDKCYYEETEALGKWIGGQKWRIIYGGANVGLMEVAAKAVTSTGGFATGIVTDSLVDKGRKSNLPDLTHQVATLSERKSLMMNLSDIFVALPGGIGTIDEVFDVLASRQLGYHKKMLILCNWNRFYDALLEQLRIAIDTRFSPAESKSFYVVVKDSTDCIEKLNEFIQQKLNE